MQTLRRWATARHGRIEEVVIAGSAVGLAFALRLALDPVMPAGFPFLTFFPAVTLTAFFATTRAGILAALVCGLLSWLFFVGPGLDYALFGRGLLPMGFYAVVTVTDVTLIDLMRRALVKLDREKQVSDQLAAQNKAMFHELQHRVSNNLQVVASMLKMQQRSLTDEGARAALDAASARLQIISGIQRQLHNPKRQSSDIGQVLADLLPEIMASTGSTAHLTVEGSGVTVSADQATPVGLIVVELVSNALEHGAKEGLAIRIAVGAEEGMARIVVADNGPGLPEGFAAERSRSLGLRLALQFADQLGGSLEFRSVAGTEATLRFPLG